MIVKLA